MSFLKDLTTVWKTLILIFVPFVASPILTIDGSKEMSCLYGVIVIASFWITEALPLAVTALSPIIIFPLLGVLSAKDVCLNYIKDASMFSFSCLTFALCVEKWKLHKRIALRTLLLMGSSPKWLTLGFMLPTWFLSMWVNNTSATAMMVPVVTAVLDQLQDIEEQKKELKGSEILGRSIHLLDKKTASDKFNYPNKEFKHMCKVLSLCICYSAALGGIGSIGGSTTNLVMQGQADLIFEKYGLQSGVNFLSWFMCCFPLAVICLILSWMWLVFHFFGIRELTSFGCGDKKNTEAMKTVIRDHLRELGPLSFAEKAVIGHFFILILSWFSMKMPGDMGWSYYFKPDYVSNSTPGLIVVLLLFIFPCEKPRVFCWLRKEKDGAVPLPKSVPALIDWKNVNEHFPWGAWLLVGGGYAIAHVCQASGLSLWIGLRLSIFSNVTPWLMVFIISLIVSFLTEITSNAATASILCPILADLAIAMELNPLYLLYPATLACSLAFMLPVATAPNAIVFAIGHIKVKDMAKAGFVLNLICVLVICIATNTWITALLQLDALPLEMRKMLNNSQLVSQFENTNLTIGNSTLY
ncbi:unnamed protein product [Lymnaea stagnalis]|uniref:Uncharacterized protein n=1 Tax=Lymnaea stagnalis TaxID=6523 RepID=A0AAV2IGD6_LYMST